jgi:hypothetical protein
MLASPIQPKVNGQGCTAGGGVATPSASEGLSLQMSGEYILAMLRDVPFLHQETTDFRFH